MIGVMRGWWSDFCERHNVCHWNNGIKWNRYGKNVSISELGVEYHFWKNAKRLMLELEIDNCGEQLVNLRVGIPFIFSFYFSLDAKPNRFTKWFAGSDWSLGGRITGFSFDKEYVSLKLHKTANGWDANKFCGYGSTYTWGDVFLGSHNADNLGDDYRIEIGDVVASKGKPDGQKSVVFDVMVRRLRSRYSRWYMFWYRKEYVRYTLSPRAEIIVPGKGENSYDLEDEKMGDISFGWDIKTFEQALASYNQSITKYMNR